NASKCPDGWGDYEALKGRYAVGRSKDGKLEEAVGTALGELEDRPTGGHTHSVSDPGHTHTVRTIGAGNTLGNAGATQAGIYGYAVNVSQGARTGIKIVETGDVKGTNAPYLQLKACVRN